ncbi:beta-lactamase class A [Barrientosiimonas humi]|uniref:Beta-lactamase class A n=1 Tax=Barrientosiimonas humi TaxID=999931 RepID=A0A542X8I9_9MICO|nr:serine hydrolase [Barrientosiimonas humi]TQL32157.1 beta-lactamase class A [Barrientosiimonas humi]CAG7572145.1 hypothetical protein BH39T_PBIAJDOK_00755 [Barrientosiimonas humi]
MTVRWSVLVQPLDEPWPWLAEEPDAVLRTASVGKCLLLSEVARRWERGDIDPAARIAWRSEDFVRDSGLWHVLDQRDLSVLDACRLVGAVSDNLATNALLREVGVAPLAALAARYALAPMALLDRVRDDRDPAQPGVADTLSRGSARALVRWLRLTHEGELPRLPLEWLALGTDLSMVAGAFGLDPLAHAEPDRGLLLVNKTGTDATVRADIGLVTKHGRTVAYAVVSGWEPGADPRDDVLSRMRAIGGAIRDRLG